MRKWPFLDIFFVFFSLMAMHLFLACYQYMTKQLLGMNCYLQANGFGTVVGQLLVLRGFLTQSLSPLGLALSIPF
jgi:hypothetical protein